MVTLPLLFDPAATFQCGQCFRFSQPQPGIFRGIARHHALTVTRQGDTLLLSCGPEEFDRIWRDYLDLDTDYPAIIRQFSAFSPLLCETAACAGGIRILRQDPWEALCSFILSQNNNIPRICGIIDRFCALLGEPLSGGGFDFPTPQRLAACSLEDLAPLRAGFRAKYLLSAAQLVTGGQVDPVSCCTLPLPQAREMLQQIHGVGPKVAECVLLYGCHRLEAFPMDVWMHRAMEKWFPGKKPEDFGPYAGIAQQMIFHYSRLHPALFHESGS